MWWNVDRWYAAELHCNEIDYNAHVLDFMNYQVHAYQLRYCPY